MYQFPEEIRKAYESLKTALVFDQLIDGRLCRYFSRTGSVSLSAWTECMLWSGSGKGSLNGCILMM